MNPSKLDERAIKNPLKRVRFVSGFRKRLSEYVRYAHNNPSYEKGLYSVTTGCQVVSLLVFAGSCIELWILIQSVEESLPIE
jgi:hypothetical protein